MYYFSISILLVGVFFSMTSPLLFSMFKSLKPEVYYLFNYSFICTTVHMLSVSSLTVGKNVTKWMFLSSHGTFHLNVDVCRVSGVKNDWPASTHKACSPRCHPPLHLWDRGTDDGERMKKRGRGAESWIREENGTEEAHEDEKGTRK